MPAPKILIVEDEPDILNLLHYNMQSQGYESCTAKDGESALRLFQEYCPDLVILDIMLPGKSGLEVCRQIRSLPGGQDTAVLLLTAKGEEQDRVLGFETGADDYVVKPFSPRELILRVQAILRRGRNIQQEQENVWQTQGLRVEFDSCLVFVDGQEVELTATEFNMLKVLIRASGRVLSREQLLDQVWGYEFVGYARTVDTHMHRLRHKLGPYSELIQTVRGFGYRLKKGKDLTES
ncbi:MAG: response regulator transcription factor [Desulfohalobiaceae bacterium]